MKKISILFIAILFASCQDKPKGFDSKIFTEKEVSDFIRLNPKWTADASTEAQVTEKFKHKLINLSNEARFLEDLPFQLKNVSDTTVSGQDVKLAVFQTFKDTSRPAQSLLNDLDLEIRAIMAQDQVGNLKVDKKYLLKGMLFKQGKRADVNLVREGDHQRYQLGRYTFWNMSVKPI